MSAGKQDASVCLVSSPPTPSLLNLFIKRGFCAVFVSQASLVNVAHRTHHHKLCVILLQINCHMGFGIVAILFAALLSVESGIHAGVTAYVSITHV